VLPSIENNAEYWLIGNNCLLQKAYSLGGKFREKNLTIPMYSSMLQVFTS
jgi:hypothetical protein